MRSPQESSEAPAGYAFREATPADAALINSEFNRVFAMQRSLDAWAWKFTQNVCGWWAIIAEDEHGGFAGHYAMTWWPFVNDGGSGVVGQAVDAFVTPEHQRRGLFSRMGARLLTRNKERGALASFGFPNPAALPGHERVGWDFPRPLRLHVRPLHPLRALIRYGRSSDPSLAPRWEPLGDVRGWRRGRSGDFQERSDLCSQPRAGISWSPDLLDWRFFRRPERRYEVLVGDRAIVAVARLAFAGLDAAAIMTVRARHLADRREGVSAAIEAARLAGCDVVVAVPSEGTPAAVLARLGFMPSPRTLPTISFAHSHNVPPTEAWGLGLAEGDFL